MTAAAWLVAAALGAQPAPDGAADPGSTWGMTLAGGYGGAVGPPSVQGHVVGRAIVRLGRAGLHFAGREGVATSDLRTLGGIFIGGQGFLGEHVALRGGFAHHHETPWEAFKDEPFASFAGVSRGITHRSGFELGGSWSGGLSKLGIGDWLGVMFDGSATVLPDAGGPPVYVGLEMLFTVRVH